MGMTSPSDRELLSQGAARQLLERAGEIDSESTTIDTLRAAAREAGISDAAFEAALVEMRGRMTRQPDIRPRQFTKRFALAGVAAVLLALALVVIPGRGSVSRSNVAMHEFTVRCLPMQIAGDVARMTLGPDADVSWTAGSRVMRARISTEDFAKLQSAFDAYAKNLPTCEK